MKKTTVWKFGTLLLIICFFIQLIVTVRYYFRMPEDFVGIIIFTTAFIFFGIAAFGFFINWKKEKKYEKN